MVGPFDCGSCTLFRIDETIDYAVTRVAWPDLDQADKFGARWTGGSRMMLSSASRCLFIAKEPD
eukprot:6483329-Amphidinium_carterae.1